MKYSLIPVIRKDQINSSGECPIYIRYTANRNSTSFPVKHTIPVNLWDDSAKLPKLKSPKFKEIYADIERIQESLTQTIEEFESKHKRLPEGKELKEELSKINNPVKIQNEHKGPTIKEDLESFIKHRQQELRSSTITVYKSTLLKWKEFEAKTKKVYFRSDINGKLFQDFRLYLLNSGILQILIIVFDISVNLILLFKKSFTNLSFALTIMVSNKESSLLKLLRILITGNLILSIFLRFRLFKILILIFLF